MTAGWKFAAAVPDVHSTATGRPLVLARPSAVNDADRSSILTCSRTRPACSSSWKDIASGVDLDPGAITTSRTPHRASSSANTVPKAVDGFTGVPAARTPPRFLLLSDSCSVSYGGSGHVGEKLGGGQRPLPPRLRVSLPAREFPRVDLGPPDGQLSPALG